MFWNKYFWPSFILLPLVAFFNWVGLINNYYGDIWWYDIPMHFFGGLWAVMFLMWSLSTQYGKNLLKYLCLKNILIFAIAVGFLWEILELILDFENIYRQGYPFDTFMDLIMDFLGGLMGSIFYKK